MCILQVTGILSWIVRSWTDVENNIVSVERVKEYDSTPKEVRHHEEGPVVYSSKLITELLIYDIQLSWPHMYIQAAWTVKGSLLPAAWPSTGNIQFADFGLQYRKGLDWALKDISINIQDREKVNPM